jgi:hypothetical protein
MSKHMLSKELGLVKRLITDVTTVWSQIVVGVQMLFKGESEIEGKKVL